MTKVYKSVLDRQCKKGFCSNSCQGMARKKSGVDDVEKNCIICNNTYMTHKYIGHRTCSKKCAIELTKQSKMRKE